MSPPTHRDPADDVDLIRLRLPALVPYGRVARLAMTGVASRNGFSYDDVEDLRIAVGEMFGVLVDPESVDEQVAFACRLLPDAIEIEACRSPRTPLREITDLTSQILSAVVDDARIDHDEGSIWIRKRLSDRS